MTQPITPTQADRDAAASAYFAWIAGNPVIPEKMRSGRVDDHSMVQAFARHAAAAREEGYRAGVEAAVADIETWFPGNMLGRPEYRAAKTLRDSVAALAPAVDGGRR